MRQTLERPLPRADAAMGHIARVSRSMAALGAPGTARGLAALSAGLVMLVGLAATLRADPTMAPILGTITVLSALGLGASLLRAQVHADGAALAIAVTLLFADLTRDLAPTVVWLFALVVPALGLINGPRAGAVAGLFAAPALHLIETGILIDPLDPQTPFGILILVALGATPGYLLAVARRRGVLLDRQLARAQILIRETEDARSAEAEARHQAVFMLARAAEARDGTTGLHIEHVRDLAAELATAVGIAPDEVQEIAWSSMLHDVGKIRVPDRVLLKPDKLDDAEWTLIRKHPLWGEELLKGDEGFSLARQIARWHHEDWDGSGYPDGLRGTAIPLAARITRVVDVYDALRSERPYKPAWTSARALEELEDMRGRGLDPELTDLFIGMHRTD